MKRQLSHSEVSSALDCQLAHAYRYTGRLTDGDALKSKSTAPVLREGRAWGRAVAAWHETGSLENAHAALTIALSLDAADQQAAGVYDVLEHECMVEKLEQILTDYTAHATRIELTRPEHELLVAIPSRIGTRASSRYDLLAYIDGIHTDEQGRDWIVEFKLRKRLQDFALIARGRQLRWYAWAWRQVTGRSVAGIIIDERLNDTPSEVKRNLDGKPSRTQSCRPDTYAAEVGAFADPEVLAKLQARKWEARHELLLTERELDEAGLQLVSAARLVHQLDTGDLYPVRNPSPTRCPGCAFRDICTDPGDTALIDALFERVVPKCERKEPITHVA